MKQKNPRPGKHDQYFKDNCDKLTAAEMQEHTGMAQHNIYKALKRLDLKPKKCSKKQPRDYTEIDKVIHENYGKMTNTDIAKKLGLGVYVTQNRIAYLRLNEKPDSEVKQCNNLTYEQLLTGKFCVITGLRVGY